MIFKATVPVISGSSTFDLQAAAVAMSRTDHSVVLVPDMERLACTVAHEGFLDQLRHENDRLSAGLVDRVRDSISTRVAEPTPLSGIPSRAAELENLIVINARPDWSDLELGSEQVLKLRETKSLQPVRDRSGNAPNFDKTVAKNRKKAKAAKAARKASR